MRWEREDLDMSNGIVFAGILMAAGMLVGCGDTHYVAIPAAPMLPATPGLQACADHAAGAQKQAFGERFNGIQFNTNDLVLTAPSLPIGTQPVGVVYDGQGQWYGTQEYRRVKFHCMLSPSGQVVYSFVRAE